MINEEACLMPDIKACKRFRNCFDALFVRDQELWFGSYLKSVKADLDNITLYSSGTSISMLKEDVLCFFDKDKHGWVMILSEHCRIIWQVNTEDEEIYLRMLASIAEDELKGSRGDYNDLAITNRIKNRYSTWFEGRNGYRRYNYGMYGQFNSNEKAYLYFDNKISSEVKKALNKVYGKPNPTTYQLPQPKFVQVNGIFTTVVWKDGTHTVVKLHKGDQFDIQTAVLYATIKRMCANNGCEMDRYLSRFSDRVIFKKETDYDRNEETYAKKDN